MRPAHRDARAGYFVIAQGRTVTGFLALLGRRAKTDLGAAADQRRFVAFGLRGMDRLGDFLGIVAVDMTDHLPAIGLETGGGVVGEPAGGRSEEHTSELQSLMRISYAVFCLKKKKNIIHHNENDT